jgi:hypothetical protein
MTSYAVLLALALALNATDRRMFALSAIVGAGIFFPVPAHWFYPICMAIEVLVALLAVRLSCHASSMIVRISILLVVMHILGWIFNGYPTASPYHWAVRLLEHAELVACILFSPQILKRWCHV